MAGHPFQVLKEAHLRASASEWVRVRPWRLAPTPVVTCGLLLAAHYPVERVAALAALFAAVVAYNIVEAIRARRAGFQVDRLFVSHLVFIGVNAAAVVLTGGLTSPLWAGMIGATVGTLYFFGRGRQSRVTLAFTSVAIVLLAVLPRSVLGPAIDYPYNVILTAWTMLFALVMTRFSAFALIDAYRSSGETIDKMREDVLCAQVARARAIESIGAKVAHELKNPLASIKGLMQLLARSATDAKSQERLRVVNAEVTRMETILRDYLSFSRPLEDIKPERVDVGDTIDEVLSVLEGRAQSAGVLISRRGGASIHGDARRLREAILNLVTNALEASAEGGSVEVSVSGGAEGAEVVIRDHGRGMAPDALARVGTPFFTTREGGTGLGVVLARAVILQHGGELSYRSEAGRGTVATVKIPERPSCPRTPVSRG